MRCFPRLVAIVFIATLSVSPAGADAIISGPACVVDGNTIQVGSKLKGSECWGGINVRLHGSIARNLDQSCTDASGNSWSCGQSAKDALSRLVRLRSITCYHLDGEFADGVPVVTCISGRRDLALEMVLQGMAEAVHDKSKRYELEETDAKQAKRGIWK